MKFKNRWLIELLREDSSLNGLLSVVEVGEWIDEGKFQSCQVIFKFGDKYYAITQLRTGSYYTDYYYEYQDWDPEEKQECAEVQKIEVMVTRWEPAFLEGDSDNI